MSPQANSRASPPPMSGGRQPLLWAALAFAAGIGTGVHAWRPPLWWLVAWIVFAASGAHLPRWRGHAAFALGLGASFVLVAFLVQVHDPGNFADPGFLRFADGAEVVITAHVTKEGIQKEETSRDVRQRLDVETEQIDKGNEKFEVHGGLRLTIYDQPSNRETTQNPHEATVRLYRYGERLRFPARIYPLRNFRNPGAFDYRAYLQENGIWALASTKAPSVEVLPGFVGNRAELRRARIHRSVIMKVHELWPGREAALMDAMVIGEDAFINLQPGLTSSARVPTTCLWSRG